MILNLTDNVFALSGALAGKNPVKLRQYDNRLWAICDDGGIVFSNNGDGATWDAANIILLPNRELAIDFLPVQGGVVIIHRNGAYAFYGSGTYQDTSILPIQAAATDPVTLTDSAVEVSNVVYVLSDRGIYQITLNGIQEIPHNQDSYFSANYNVWLSQGGIQGSYLPKFRAILYLFQSNYGSQGFMFNIRTGAFQKINKAMVPSLPYFVGIPSIVDFLLGTDATTVSRSVYPAPTQTEGGNVIIQTRHEDSESLRDKIWREVLVTVDGQANGVSITAILNQSTPAPIATGLTLYQGTNYIPLFDGNGDVLRCQQLSLLFTIQGSGFTIKEIAVRARETGAQLGRLAGN